MWPRAERWQTSFSDSWESTPGPSARGPPIIFPFKPRAKPSLVSLHHHQGHKIADPFIGCIISGRISNKEYVASYSKRLRYYRDYNRAYSAATAVSTTVVENDNPYPLADGTGRQSWKTVDVGGRILRSDHSKTPHSVGKLPRTSREARVSAEFHRKLGRDSARVSRFVGDLLRSKGNQNLDAKRPIGQKGEGGLAKKTHVSDAAQDSHRNSAMTGMALRSIMERHKREAMEARHALRFGGGGDVGGEIAEESSIDDYKTRSVPWYSTV